MARDTREPVTGLDRNKYFKGTYTTNNKLTRDTVVQGVFYSSDYESVKILNEVVNNVKHIKKTVKLLTNDYIPDLQADYFVLYDNEYWLVESVDKADIIDNAKPFKRHSNQYIVSLKQW